MKALVTSVLVIGTVINIGWWSTWCQRNLIMDDPYDYEDLTVDQLIYFYPRYPNEVMRNEIQKRLTAPWVSDGDKARLRGSFGSI